MLHRKAVLTRPHPMENTIIWFCSAKIIQAIRILSSLCQRVLPEGFYTKPRIDDELLAEYHEGLVCLSACLAGEIPQKLLDGDYAGAKSKAEFYRDIFGSENFFIELQDHGIEEQKRIIPSLIKLAREIGVDIVATNDCHYIEKQDSTVHNILLCIQTNRTVNDSDRMEFKTSEFYLKTEDEMREVFANYPEAIDNTQKIADMCMWILNSWCTQASEI